MRALGLLTLLVTAAVAIASAAVSQTADSPAGKDALLEWLKKQGVTVERMGEPLDGLDSYYGYRGTQPMTIYLSPNGQVAFVGLAYGPAGEDVTAKQLGDLARAHGGALPGMPQPAQAMAPVAPPAAAVAAAPANGPVDGPQSLAATHWREIGRASAPMVYMIIDLDCPYCKQAWTALRQPVMDGAIRLRVVPVSILSTSTSRPRGAAFLMAPDPTAALDAAAANQLVPLDPPPSKADAALALNGTYLARNPIGGRKFDATPTFVYKGVGNSLQVDVGLPNGSVDVLLQKVRAGWGG